MHVRQSQQTRSSIVIHAHVDMVKIPRYTIHDTRYTIQDTAYSIQHTRLQAYVDMVKRPSSSHDGRMRALSSVTLPSALPMLFRDTAQLATAFVNLSSRTNIVSVGST